VVWILRQLGVVVLGIVIYFGVRGLTEGRPSVALDHARDVLRFEEQVRLDQEHRIQDLLVGRDWLVDAANWVYIWGHWPVIAGAMLWLALRHRLVFLRLRNAMLLSGGVGLVIYASYPVAPPRLVQIGLVDTVSERSHAYRYLQPPAFVNQYAAMPSLHVGWDLLVGIAIFTAAGTMVLKWLGVLMPLFMASAVVLTANHYVVDGFAGSVLALAGLAGAVWLERHYPPRAAGPAWAGPPERLPEPRRSGDSRSRTAVT
jgi:hypothetical protein